MAERLDAVEVGLRAAARPALGKGGALFGQRGEVVGLERECLAVEARGLARQALAERHARHADERGAVLGVRGVGGLVRVVGWGELRAGEIGVGAGGHGARQGRDGIVGTGTLGGSGKRQQQQRGGEISHRVLHRGRPLSPFLTTPRQ